MRDTRTHTYTNTYACARQSFARIGVYKYRISRIMRHRKRTAIAREQFRSFASHLTRCKHPVSRSRLSSRSNSFAGSSLSSNVNGEIWNISSLFAMTRDTDARSARERNCVDRSTSVSGKNYLHESTSPSSPLRSQINAQSTGALRFLRRSR